MSARIVVTVRVRGFITTIPINIINIITARTEITVTTTAAIITTTTIITIPTMTIADAAFTKSCCRRARCS